MQISKQASKVHLIVGSILVFLSLASCILSLFFTQTIFAFLIFFFGVWGGVELGRYLEHVMQLKNDEDAEGE